jgi:hypothetical protein
MQRWGKGCCLDSAPPRRTGNHVGVYEVFHVLDLRDSWVHRVAGTQPLPPAATRAVRTAHYQVSLASESVAAGTKSAAGGPAAEHETATAAQPA